MDGPGEDAIARSEAISLLANAAIHQYYAGEEITTACPTCGRPLRVREIRPIKVIWVRCLEGHVLLRRTYTRLPLPVGHPKRKAGGEAGSGGRRGEG